MINHMCVISVCFLSIKQLFPFVLMYLCILSISLCTNPLSSFFFFFFGPDWELLLGNQMIWMLIVLVSLDVHICTRFNHCMTDNKNTLLKKMHHVDSDTEIVMILRTNCKYNVLHFQMIKWTCHAFYIFIYLFFFK